jgi:ubiquinone/menaquinone biosynthesis C-methylase UbiE
MLQKDLYQDIWKRKQNCGGGIQPGGRVDAALKVLGKGEILLDIGCGNGQSSAIVKNRYTKIIGLDISLKALSFAREKGLFGIMVNLNRGNIPLKDEMVDAVICLDVIEHIFDPYSLLGEVYRVLKKDGELILTTPNTRFVKHISDLMFRGTPPKTNLDTEGYDGGHLHYFTFADLKRILKECKFYVLLEKGISRRFYNSWKLRLFYLVSRLWEKDPMREFFCQGIMIKAGKVLSRCSEDN